MYYITLFVKFRDPLAPHHLKSSFRWPTWPKDNVRMKYISQSQKHSMANCFVNNGQLILILLQCQISMFARNNALYQYFSIPLPGIDTFRYLISITGSGIDTFRYLITIPISGINTSFDTKLSLLESIPAILDKFFTNWNVNK